MSKKMKRTIVLLMAALIILLCAPAGSCAGQIAEYHIAEVDVQISLPEEWYYSDRAITDDDPFCKVLSKTAAEFKKSYLDDNTYLFAYDFGTGTFMNLDVEETKASDYSKMSDAEVKAAGDKEFAWLEKDSDSSISKSVIMLNGTSYYKLISEEKNDLTIYYYDTVKNGKRYQFVFIVDSENNGPTTEKLYDSIIDTVALPGTSGGREAANDTENPQSPGDEGTGRFRFDDCFMIMRKNYVYTKRGDQNMDQSEKYLFDNDEHFQALVYYDGMQAFVVSYPRKHKEALSNNECLSEIITYANGGFGHVSTSFSAYILDSNSYFFVQKGDIMGQTVEYLTMYYFHKNGIVVISLNDTFEQASQREKSIDFLMDLIDSLAPLEAMPTAGAN